MPVKRFLWFDNPMHSSRVARSSSATTARTIVSGDSQPESAAGQHLRGSCMGLPTTTHTPGSTQIPATDQPYAGLIMLAEASASQGDPFQELATYQTITCVDGDQEQSDNFSSLSNESSQRVVGGKPTTREDPEAPAQDDNIPVLPARDSEEAKTRIISSIPKKEIMPSINDHFRRALTGIVPKAILIAITGDPKFLTGHNIAEQNPDPDAKWIKWSGDVRKPYMCGYQICGRKFTRKAELQTHFAKHGCDSKFRCYLGECTGAIKYPDNEALSRHIRANHTFERPYQCEFCKMRFGRIDTLKKHNKRKHSNKNQQKSPKKKRK